MASSMRIGKTQIPKESIWTPRIPAAARTPAGNASSWSSLQTVPYYSLDDAESPDTGVGFQVFQGTSAAASTSRPATSPLPTRTRTTVRD
eukprot:6400027-Pyramimonas_sp.AAC.1